MNALSQFWHAHAQKASASILMAIDGINLAALQFFQQDIVQFFGPHRGPTIFSGLRMALGALIFWRATQKPKAAA